MNRFPGICQLPPKSEPSRTNSIGAPGTGRSRRQFLAATAGTAVGGAGGRWGVLTGPVAAQSSGADLSKWSANADSVGTVVDERGESEVVATVDAQGNSGTSTFAPAALRIGPGTTVVWEWVGER